MPAQDYWETLLDVDSILNAFGIGAATGEVAELGCGYGTFTVPVARRTGAPVHAFDIEPDMIEATVRRAKAAGIENVTTVCRDVCAGGFGLADASCGACLLFNILHGEHPVDLLREAARVVRPGGMIAVIHWRSDVVTPRGPGLDIRPRPEQVIRWVEEVGGSLHADGPALPLPPWHYGVRLIKA